MGSGAQENHDNKWPRSRLLGIVQLLIPSGAGYGVAQLVAALVWPLFLPEEMKNVVEYIVLGSMMASVGLLRHLILPHLPGVAWSILCTFGLLVGRWVALAEAGIDPGAAITTDLIPTGIVGFTCARIATSC